VSDEERRVQTNGFLESAFGLKDRVCLVTGGTSGIGRVIASGFAQAGATVTVGSSNPEKVARTAEELGEGHSGLRMDVTDEESIRAAVRKVVEERGRLDVLVNAAGVTQRVPSMEMELEDWERIIRVNLTGTFVACREAGKVMVGQEPRENADRGCILNVASLSSFVAFEGVAAYGCSKAGVMHLTKSLANDWAQHGIRVNAVAPGVFPTDLNARLVEGTPRGEWLLGHTPLGRFGKADELVGAAVYLCGGSASFTTGETLTVDGGFLARGVGV
jgi:NAD(P)-dependent dehydrogenase (short-subunit alcohol dehydrogenase family)